MIIDCTERTDLPPEWVGMIDDPDLRIPALKGALSADPSLPERLLSLQVTDSTRPYGRRVLLEGENLEIMLASWTRGVPCAPHDHGGSLGVVRVLQGRAHHKIYRVGAPGLEIVREEIAEAGQLLVCGKDMVHSMGDDGADQPLVTLHMYTGPVPYMVVYDTLQEQTLKVDGGCGAWVPASNSDLLLKRYEGILPVHEVL